MRREAAKPQPGEPKSRLQTTKRPVCILKSPAPSRRPPWAGIAEGDAHGGFEKLGDKYFSDQKAAFKQLNVPFLF